MNLRKTCPDIPDDWKGSMADTCRILGENKPISPKTVRKYIERRGLEIQRGSNGRPQITGSQVKLIWSMI